MNSATTIVLPGLDGTDLLLGRFCELAPEANRTTVCTLPDDPTDDYDSLCDHFSARIQGFDSCHLIAESFSGPLGILLAHRHPSVVTRLTLVSTFASSPVPYVARMIPWSLLFRLPMPSMIARHYFVGSHKTHPSNLIAELKHAVRQASPKTLVRRIHCVMDVDVTKQLSELSCDIAYLRPRHDRLVSAWAVRAIVKANPSVVVREIDGPHLILQTRPQKAWDCILG